MTAKRVRLVSFYVTQHPIVGHTRPRWGYGWTYGSPAQGNRRVGLVLIIAGRWMHLGVLR